MTQKEIHEKAIRLIEGGVVEIDGNWFRLVYPQLEGRDIPCMMCELDSICRRHHVVICGECEAITHKKCMLELRSAKLR